MTFTPSAVVNGEFHLDDLRLKKVDILELFSTETRTDRARYVAASGSSNVALHCLQC